MYFDYTFGNQNQNHNQISDEFFQQIFLNFSWNPLIYFDVVV